MEQHLPDRLKAAMKAAGITSAELARRANVSKATISLGLHGKSALEQSIEAIAGVLGVSVQWLTIGDESQAPRWALSPGLREPLQVYDDPMARIQKTLDRQIILIEALLAKISPDDYKRLVG